MQKRDKQASILLWALFLSTFIASLFLFVSYSVQKNIKNTLFFSDLINLPFLINKIWNDKNILSLSLGENEYIKKRENNVFSLAEGESQEFRFEKFISSLSWSIDIISSWGILWHTFVDIDTSPFSATNSFSWLISSWSTFTWMTSTWTEFWILYIKNLGWYTSFSLDTSEIFIPEETEYQIIKKISWMEVESKSFKKRNFTPWDFPWLNYTKYWMEF